MPAASCAPKLTQPAAAVFDSEFTSSFYKPYEAAAHTALVLLDDARSRLCMQTGEICVHSMTYRLKSPASIRDKLIKKALPVTCAAAGAALHDIAGLRVVLSSENAVYRYAEIIRRSPVVELLDIHDYIASPKPSGYRSLHLLLRVPVSLGAQAYMTPVEIQLRTAPMDVWASIEHAICYKPVPRT